MAGASAEVVVGGLVELNRAFARINSGLKKQLRGELMKAAEPVRERAAELAASEIRNIGPRWSQMRVGVTSSTVYVAPRARRRRGRPRPNLAPLLFDRAMSPALDQKQGEVVESLHGLIDRLADSAGF